MHACRELFDSLDVDKSGQLDVAEITKLAKMFYGTTATTSSATVCFHIIRNLETVHD